MPPPPDPLYGWEPVAYPATVALGDDDELLSGFQSFGVATVPIDGGHPPDLFVIAHGERLTGMAYKGVLALAQRAKWFVLLAQTTNDWESGHLDHEAKSDGRPCILAPLEWWIQAIDNECPRANVRLDLIFQAHLLWLRQGVPREVGTALFVEMGP